MTSIQEFNCIFCEENFDTKEALQIHFRKHGDPKFNEKKNKGRIQSAIHAPSDSSKDDVEMVGCDVCSEVFTTISKAITHKHKVHPEHDAKYFCPWCGKLFTMKHLYNKHMQANHSQLEKNEDNTFHCDVCNVNFNLPTAIIHHNRFYHRQDTDIPQFGQSKKLKMYNQESLPIYYCSFCGEEYENKVNLHKHSIDDHNDENQSPDVVLRCPLCDAIFYHLDAYELHLTFHTPDDLYSERSEMADDVSEYSLESVPPIMEKVESSEPQQDAETTVKEMGIEDFLEQVLEESDGTASKKNKKHRKHKKSKKAAITLDEFLNMNKDVFGEGLDFQGVEEVPTRVITKRLKVTKTPPNAVSEIAPELEKLRKHGIVIKKKPGQNITKRNREQLNKPLKVPTKVTVHKVHMEPQVSTSEDTIDKLINQTNSQIKIIKKSSKDNSSGNKTTSITNKIIEESNDMECDSTKKDDGEPLAKDIGLENISVTVEDKKQQSENNGTVLRSESHMPLDNTDETLYGNTDFKNEDVSENEVEKSKAITNINHIKVESTSNCEDSHLEIPNNAINIEKQSKVDSLSSLKRLSHLITVKSVIPTQNAGTADWTLIKNIQPVNLHIAKDKIEALITRQRDSINNSVCGTDFKDDEFKNDSQSNADENEMKSFSPQVKSDTTHFTTPGNDTSDLKNKSTKTTSRTCNLNITKKDNSKNPELVQSKHISTNIEKISTTTETNYSDIEKQDTTHLLKHLTGITAKPIGIAKSTNEQNSSLTKRNINEKNTRKILPQKEIIDNEEVEIYNIDDSDDEIDQSSAENNNSVTNITQHSEVLKNLSKNITVRPISLNTPEKINIIQQDQASNEKKYAIANEIPSRVSNETHDTDLSINKLAQPISERDVALKMVLKNLSKNVTFKSKTTSPSQFVQSQDQSDINCKYEHNSDSLNTVKITEVTEAGSEDESENENINGNVIVESPGDSHSDKEESEDIDTEEADFENQIKTNMLKKNEEPLQFAHSIPGVSEMSSPSEETMKRLSEKNDENDDIFEGHLNLDITKNLGNQISIKPMKQVKKELKHENIINAQQICGQSSSHSQINQKVDVSNQVKNTVNKKVMVKTFQTQTRTVIQEITTTVTKTIKTVNQSVKQEIRNNFSSTSTLPQKLQGMRVNQQSRNLQGIVVRHSSPPMRPKIGIIPPTKSAVGTTVKHSSQAIPVGTSVKLPNQIGPIRPRSNVVRPSIPRMPSAQKLRPTTSMPPSLRVGRPIRVSSDAVAVPVKRPGLGDTSGPFSCFKKPKESLIPVSDVPTFNNGESESMVEYTSVSKSNTMSTVATLKGNSVITSSQTKSEVNTSSQQLSRFNNTSGIRVSKLSQSKQAQVQDTSEISASQRTTLEAIQKLQKQGLLVKKPRLDIRQDSEGSDHSGNNSTDEND